jgi:hypothetical protein
LVKKCPLIASLNSSPNIAILYYEYLASQRLRQDWLSRVNIRYRKSVERYKDIVSDFYSNGSPNDELK